MSEMTQFGVVDFIVFIGMLVLAIAIGVFYACKDRKKKSIENYYFGGRHMSPVPVGLSLAVTFISSTVILSYPAYSYVYGTVVIWFGLAASVQLVIACIYYIPLYQRLQLTSVYEYLERRFHKGLKTFCSLFVVFNVVLYMSTTMYLTALALNVVTPMGIEASILVTAGVCTLYTTLGGMKAVVWTDALQAIIMAGGSIALLIKTTIMVGGVGKVHEAIVRGGRDTFLDFNPDPTLRHTAWTIFVGMGLTTCGASCISQAFVQRYQTCKNVRDARIALIVSGIPMISFVIIAALNGCAMYAYYEGCDPYKEGRIRRIDQAVPLLVLEVFEDTPGMAGLFVSAAYSGLLSTASSGINAISALILQDAILPCKPDMKETTQLTISKFLGLALGTATASISFLVKYIGKTIVQISLTLIGIFLGPVLGIFTAGIFFPWTNTIGAVIGMISGLSFSLWVAIGQILYPATPESKRELSLSIGNCTNDVMTYGTILNSNSSTATNANHWITTESGWTDNITTTMQDERPYLADTLYSVSYLYLGSFGFAMSLMVSLLVSFFTGKTDPKSLDPALFVPFIDNKYLPEKIRTFFRFGVPELPERDGKTDRLSLKIDKETASNLSPNVELSNVRLTSSSDDALFLVKD